MVKKKRRISSVKPQEGKQTLAFTTKVDFMIYGGARGAGKSLPLDTNIPTPKGFVKLKDLKVGDNVIGKDGKPNKIIKLHPIEKQDTYEILFDDGTKQECSLEHLWEIKQHKLSDKEVINTAKLIDLVSKDNNEEILPLVSLSKEVEFNECSSLLTDPYSLGKGINTLDSNMFSSILFSSVEYRYNFVCGVLEEDGFVDSSGGIYLYSRKNNITEFIIQLIFSLGGLCCRSSKKENFDRDNPVKYIGCTVLNIKHHTPDKFFRDKSFRYKPKPYKKLYRKITAIIPKEKQAMRCITVESDDGLFLTGERFLVTHNSELLAMRPLEYINDPKFSGIFFRRQYAELTGAGGLWDKSKRMYPEFKARSNISNLRWDFKSGAQIRMSHMHTEANKESHRGLQYSFIGFDEIDQFSQEQVQFLLTCLRSEADMDSFCIGTLNPSPDSWVYPIVKWYLDDEGTPDPDKCGVIRYYIILDGEFVFGDSEDYFKENFPDSVYVHNPITGEDLYIPPKTFTFIAGNIFDNPALIEANPRYLSELQNLPEHERLRQLWGNWHARPTGSNFFQRSWLNNADKVPDGSIGVRSYDLAAREPSENYKHPDATTSVLYWKSPQGYYYLTGNYIEEFKDEVSGQNVYGRLRKRIGDRNRIMMSQADYDGANVTVIIPVDPSSAGIQAFEDLAKQFSSNGNSCKRDPTATTTKKLTKFLPFADAAQNGLVYIVKDSFPNEETVDFILKELESFDGSRSSSFRKDDFPDCIASAHNGISKSKSIEACIIPTIDTPTLLAKHRHRVR